MNAGSKLMIVWHTTRSVTPFFRISRTYVAKFLKLAGGMSRWYTIVLSAPGTRTQTIRRFLSVQRLPPPALPSAPTAVPNWLCWHAAQFSLCLLRAAGSGETPSSEKQSGASFVGFFGSYFWR